MNVDVDRSWGWIGLGLVGWQGGRLRWVDRTAGRGQFWLVLGVSGLSGWSGAH